MASRAGVISGPKRGALKALAILAGLPIVAVLAGLTASASTPTIGAIKAEFKKPVTTYTLMHPVPDPANVFDTVTYTWANSNGCGDFAHNDSSIDTWSHPDSGQPGACPNEAVHKATITVDVIQAGFICHAEYQGGSAMGNGLPGTCMATTSATPSPSPSPSPAASASAAPVSSGGAAASTTGGFPVLPVGFAVAIAAIAFILVIGALRGGWSFSSCDCDGCDCDGCDCDDCDGRRRPSFDEPAKAPELPPVPSDSSGRTDDLLGP